MQRNGTEAPQQEGITGARPGGTSGGSTAQEKGLESFGRPGSADEAADLYFNQKIGPEIKEGKAQIIGADDMKDHFGKDYDNSRHGIYSGGANKIYQRLLAEDARRYGEIHDRRHRLRQE